MPHELEPTDETSHRWREVLQPAMFDPSGGCRPDLAAQQSAVEAPAAPEQLSTKPPAADHIQSFDEQALSVQTQWETGAAFHAAGGTPSSLPHVIHDDAEVTAAVHFGATPARGDLSTEDATPQPAWASVGSAAIPGLRDHAIDSQAPPLNGGIVASEQAPASFGPTPVASVFVDGSSAARSSVQQVSDGGHAPTVSNKMASSGPVHVSNQNATSPAEEAVTEATTAAAAAQGATGAQVVQALGGNSTGVTGAGIKVGVLSNSFNNLGGAAADEASGALPSAANIQILKDMPSGGDDEGRAMMQIVHDIAPGASLAYYTAVQSEQDFANGIIALANAGCKVIVDDVSYLDEPFFQNGVVAQAIQTVQAMGVTYVAAAGNNGSTAAYQGAWSPISGVYDGIYLANAQNFGGSALQTITVSSATSDYPVTLLLQWDQPWGQSTSSFVLDVFKNGSYAGGFYNTTSLPFMYYKFTSPGTYQIAIENTSGNAPSQIKDIAFGNGLPVTISGANVGAVFGHAMTPGVLTSGAINSLTTPAFGNTPVAEHFSSSGTGTEILFANNGARLNSPLQLSPVVISGVDNIATTVAGSLGDFYGTSASAASIAGVAALILAANPSLSYADVSEIMQQTALAVANPAVAGAGLAQINPAVGSAPYFANTVIEALGSISLTQSGVIYDLNANAGSATVALRFGGANVITHQLGGWLPIGGETNGSGGYEVAWKFQGQDLYTVWNVDSSGNYTGNAIGAVSGNTISLETLETTFHQDLNGDGTIGVVSTVIEAQGSTSLVQTGNTYFLNPVAGGTGPQVKFGGSAVTPGQLGGWAPIAAEAVGVGYQIAWKIAGADLYTVWNVDSSGNYTGNAIGAVSGHTISLETLETTFHQDLNGDGTIGVVSTVIEAQGSTGLVQTGNTYFLNPVAGGTGPQIMYGGSIVTAGQFDGWTPIGAEAVSGGYQIAWKMAGSDLYTVWNTDSNGNYTGNAIGAVAGSSASLEALETSFHQDLNGDGTIGVPTAVIESMGSTSLVQSGSVYLLHPVSGGTGPQAEIEFGGSVVVAGQLGGWTPIAAEISATGYQIAWKMAGADLYTVWNTDSNGNYVNNAIGAVAGHSAALEALEPSFHQDLNGDGTIGVPAGSSGVASLPAATASSTTASFDGHTLTLSSPATFNGTIAGFGADGADQIDLNGISFSTLRTSFDSTATTLTVSDGSTTAQLHFAGASSPDGFHFADDQHGGTLLYAGGTPTASGRDQSAPFSGGNHDAFVFAQNFGQISIANFAPATDSIAFSKAVFASQDALLAAIHDDANGNAAIVDAAHDTITLQHVTTAALLAHLSDLHIV